MISEDKLGSNCFMQKYMLRMVLEQNHSSFVQITRILETPVIVILGVETTIMLNFKICLIQDGVVDGKGRGGAGVAQTLFNLICETEER